MSKFFFIVAILIFVFIEIDAGVKRKHNEVVSNDNKPPKRSRKQGTPQQAWTGHLGLLKLENHSYCEVMSVLLQYDLDRVFLRM